MILSCIYDFFTPNRAQNSFPIYLILNLFLFCPLNAQSLNDGKHLFILSGQSNMVRLNVEDTLIPTLAAEFGSDHIIVVKDAMGSQPISRWYKGWVSSDGSVPKARGDLYDSLMEKVYSEIENQQIRTVTFVWIHGERDARISEGDVYMSSVIGLFNQLKRDLQRENINMVIARLSDFDLDNEKWPHWTKVRQAQEKIADEYSNILWVNTDDLNTGFNNNNEFIQDDLHYTVEGYRILGIRVAESAIKLIRSDL
ncbi:MAG: hypothetical protein JJ966_11065 [Balneolaceae bacterium]|nr:hypothetical protein [Balneolaceae bacterium]